MMNLIRDLWFKRRDIVSQGYDDSLEYISRLIPLEIVSVPTGTQCWTWTVPEKWEVNNAYIEDLEGNRLLSLEDHPLHVMSYSLPIDQVVSKEELMKHLYSNPQRPGAIPFNFKYYQRDWGFCIQHNRLESFNEEQYKVFIDTTFEEGSLKIGVCTIPGEIEDVIVLVAHLCHPAMVNDDLTGVAVLVDLAKELMKKQNHYTYKLLFLPETIGSISYLSQNEEIIPKLKYGIFLEMLGNDNIHALQLSRRGNTLIDRVCQYVLKRKVEKFNEGPFRKIVGNDEMVFDGPGIFVPMPSISRWPYPEYHSSDDTPEIITGERLNESKELVLEILRILDLNYYPKRQFKGPVFLSGYGLWVDWRVNKKLNQNLEQIMLRLEGDKSIFDITEDLDMEFDDVLNYINAFEQNGLITRNEVH
jgi:aminopeptidase-like protein